MNKEEIIKVADKWFEEHSYDFQIHSNPRMQVRVIWLAAISKYLEHTDIEDKEAILDINQENALNEDQVVLKAICTGILENLNQIRKLKLSITQTYLIEALSGVSSAIIIDIPKKGK